MVQENPGQKNNKNNKSNKPSTFESGSSQFQSGSAGSSSSSDPSRFESGSTLRGGIGGGEFGSASGGEGKVKQTARQVKHEVKEGVNEVKQKASSAFERQKETAAHKVESVSSAIRDTAQKLHEKDVPGIAGLVEQAADSIEHLSESIREGDLRDMMSGMQDWARRHPAIFLGGSLLAGMLLARFIKSSAQREFENHNEFGNGSRQYGYGSYGEPDEFEGEYGSSERLTSGMSQYSAGSQAPASATPGMTIPGSTPGQTGPTPESSSSWEES